MKAVQWQSRDFVALAGSAWALLLALFVVVPLLILFTAWDHIDQTVWSHLLQFGLREALVNSLALALGTALLSLCIGVYFAWMTTQYQFRGRRLITVLLLMPLAMPSYVLAFVLVGVTDYAGWIGQTWHALTGSRQGFPLKNAVGAIFILSLSLYPYVFVAAREGLLKTQRNLIDAARSQGASPSGVFFRVGLPIALPWICSGTLLVMMEALADFGVAGMLNVTTLPTAIYKTWYGFFSLNSAAQLASVLLFPSILLLLAKEKSDHLAQKRRGVTGNWHLSRQAPTLGMMLCFSLMVVLVMGFAFVGPVVRLLAWVVSDVRGGFTEVLSGLLPVLTNSVIIAGSVAVFTVVSSWVIYLAQRWTHFRRFFALITGTTIAYALPGTLLAVAFYLPAVALENSVSWELGLTSSIGLTIFALMLRFQAVSHNTLGPSMRAIPFRLEDAARSLRAGSLRVIWSLFRPNLRTASGLAAMLVFIDVVKELPLTMMMRPFGWDTLAIKVFEFSSDGDWYRAAIPALILIVLSSSSALLLATRILRGEATAC